MLRSTKTVLSKLFRFADNLALKIHLLRPTSIEGMQLVENGRTKPDKDTIDTPALPHAAW